MSQPLSAQLDGLRVQFWSSGRTSRGMSGASAGVRSPLHRDFLTQHDHPVIPVIYGVQPAAGGTAQTALLGAGLLL